MTLWLAIAITVVASTGNSVGKALQKQATKALPRFTLERKVLWMYLRSTEWLVGVAADLLGGVLMVAAYSLAPVSIVQPVSGVGLVTLAVFSHFYLKERLQRLEWTAVAMAGVGTLGLGTEGSEEDGPINVLRVFVVFGAMLTLLVMMMLMQRRAAAAGGSSSSEGQSRRASATACALQAGMCFGLSAAALRIGILLTKRSALWLVLGVSGSLALTSSGFVLQTRGLKDGNTVLVCTCAAVMAMVSGVLVGLAGLGEALPASARGKALRFACWALILIGVFLIANGPGGAQTAVVVVASRTPRWMWSLLPTDTAIALRQAAHKLELPVNAHQASN